MGEEVSHLSMNSNWDHHQKTYAKTKPSDLIHLFLLFNRDSSRLWGCAQSLNLEQ